MDIHNDTSFQEVFACYKQLYECVNKLVQLFTLLYIQYNRSLHICIPIFQLELSVTH